MPAGMKSSNESPPLLSVLDQLLDGTPFVARCSWVCLSCACLLVSTVGLCGWCYQSTCPFHLHLLLMMRIGMLSWRQRIAYLSHTLSSHSKSYSGLGFREFRTSISLSLVTFRLSPLSFIRVFSDNSENLLNPVVLVPSVAVSVTKDFLRDWIVSPVPNPEPGGSVDHFSSDLYHSTCPAWVTLPALTGIALRVTEVHKPPDHDKVMIPQGE